MEQAIDPPPRPKVKTPEVLERIKHLPKEERAKEYHRLYARSWRELNPGYHTRKNKEYRNL